MGAVEKNSWPHYLFWYHFFKEKWNYKIFYVMGWTGYESKVVGVFIFLFLNEIFIEYTYIHTHTHTHTHTYIYIYIYIHLLLFEPVAAPWFYFSLGRSFKFVFKGLIRTFLKIIFSSSWPLGWEDEIFSRNPWSERRSSSLRRWIIGRRRILIHVISLLEIYP